MDAASAQQAQPGGQVQPGQQAQPGRQAQTGEHSGPGEAVSGPVGLVLVSHSALLAEGAAQLAGQLAGPQVRIEPAGGDADGGLGTDAEKVAEAISRADRGAGVLLLADLGSSVLTVRLLLEDGGFDGPAAIDQASTNQTPINQASTYSGPRALLADAPFVEGAVSAAVAAGSGADLAAVLAAAEEARQFRKAP